MTNTIIKGEEAKKKYKFLKDNNMILGEFIVGSTAFGTNSPTSDIDKNFVYIDSLEDFLSGNLTEKIEVTKDYAGYEIGRFIELLSRCNPGILDLSNSNTDCIISMHPLYKKYIVDNAQKFLTKKVKESFSNYAYSQIKKANGENKKFRQEMEKERRGLLDFCYVGKGQGSIPLKEFLKKKKINIEACGCVAINHMKNCYHLFVDRNCKATYKRITDKDDVQIVLSSIGKEEKPVCLFYANREGFSKYCKDYKQYWDWEKNKNKERFNDNIKNGCLYNSKNMSHCHRLLDTCIEILRDGKFNIKRQNREQLIAIRKGVYPYEQLIEDADTKIKEIERLYTISTLKEEVEKVFIDKLLYNIRADFYQI